MSLLDKAKKFTPQRKMSLKVRRNTMSKKLSDHAKKKHKTKKKKVDVDNEPWEFKTGTISVKINEGGIAEKTKEDTFQCLMKVQNNVGLMLQQLKDPSYILQLADILRSLGQVYGGIKVLPTLDTKSSWTWTSGGEQSEESTDKISD